MKGSYDDILSRIPDAPLWYDENGVPRFEPFAPHWKAEPLAQEAALVEVVCQHCLRAFMVCCSHASARAGGWRLVAEAISDNGAGLYGDPPMHTTEAERLTGMDGCRIGETMTVIPLRVLEYWRRDAGDWVRDGALERAFTLTEREAARVAAGKW